MPEYRSDLEAALARSRALERELAETERELAEAEAEIEDLKNPKPKKKKKKKKKRRKTRPEPVDTKALALRRQQMLERHNKDLASRSIAHHDKRHSLAASALCGAVFATTMLPSGWVAAAVLGLVGVVVPSMALLIFGPKRHVDWVRSLRFKLEGFEERFEKSPEDDFHLDVVFKSDPPDLDFIRSRVRTMAGGSGEVPLLQLAASGVSAGADPSVVRLSLIKPFWQPEPGDKTPHLELYKTMRRIVDDVLSPLHNDYRITRVTVS